MNVKKDSGGTDVLLVLQIIFIVLKCVNVIRWSWWAVLTPTWISLFIFIIAVVFISIYHK